MALDVDWCQQLLRHETTLAPPKHSEIAIGRAWIDGVLVVWDLDDPPGWLDVVLAQRDEDGNVERPDVGSRHLPAVH